MNSSSIKPNAYLPDRVSPPGETLADLLEERSMTQKELADRTGLSRKTVNQIIKGKAPLSQETALVLEKALGTPAGFWISREKNYREFLARAKAVKRQAAYIEWAKAFPYAAMVKKKWVEPAATPAEKTDRLLSFFGVATPKSWHELYARPQVVFRRSEKFGRKTEVISAWLRQGEILAERTPTVPYSEVKLTAALLQIRKLCADDAPNEFVPRMQSLCAEAGVLYLLVPELPSLGVSGVTRWLGDRPLIQQCLRFKTNDHFWFTFLHEAKHVLQNRRRHVFVEASGLAEKDIAHEEEADRFAAETLIPESAYRAFLVGEPFSRGGSPASGIEAIRQFAGSIDLHPGVVVGRLQREGVISYGHPAGQLKVKFEWTAPEEP